MPTTTRFAPSPTGQIHLGNARAALFNWLIARHDSGRFLLRIEDTDTAREVSGGIDAILADMAWLGLEHDEAPWRQSQRSAIYDEALATLSASGHLYPCFCSEQALKLSRRAQQQASQAPRYAGTCAGIAPAEATRRIGAGEAHTLRFRVPTGKTVSFTDRVHGEQSFRTDDIGDFVVRRSDGSPAFFFANAMDDSLAGVTLVLRGDDHLSNTPRQLLILECLGLRTPEYGHLPLIHDTGGGKMSKRGGALTVGNLRELGYHPLAICNYLARVGGHVEGQVAYTLDALAQAFDGMRFGRAAARYDEDQLRYWQRHTLDSLDDTAVWEWMGLAVHTRVPDVKRADFIALVRPNALFPGEALDWTFVLFDDDPMPQKPAIALLQDAESSLFSAALESYDPSLSWNDWLARIKQASGLKGPALFKPLRAALTGRMDGPDLAGVHALLTPERIRTRLDRARSLAA